MHKNEYVAISKADRTSRNGNGKRVSTEMLLHVLQAKFRNPLASRRVLADLARVSVDTVQTAMTTPYAERQLAAMGSDLDVLRAQVAQDTGDSLTYLGSSVRRGITEVVKTEPLAHVLANAREAASMYARQVLPETVRVKGQLKGPDDFDELEQLENSAEYQAFVALLEEGQGRQLPEQKETPAEAGADDWVDPWDE